MALATMIAELTKARKDYQEKLAALGSDTQKAIAEFLSPRIPEGFAVQWNQYTPYFNDGEPCTFRLGDPYLVKLDPTKNREHISRYAEDSEEPCVGLSYGLAGYDLEGPSHEETRPNGSKYTQPHYEAVEGAPRAIVLELAELWRQLPEDMLEAAFGDHVRVRVFHDGTATTNDHDHD